MERRFYNGRPTWGIWSDVNHVTSFKVTTLVTGLRKREPTSKFPSQIRGRQYSFLGKWTYALLLYPVPSFLKGISDELERMQAGWHKTNDIVFSSVKKTLCRLKFCQLALQMLYIYWSLDNLSSSHTFPDMIWDWTGADISTSVAAL